MGAELRWLAALLLLFAAAVLIPALAVALLIRVRLQRQSRPIPPFGRVLTRTAMVVTVVEALAVLVLMLVLLGEIEKSAGEVGRALESFDLRRH